MIQMGVRQIALLKHQRLKPLAMAFDSCILQHCPLPKAFGINRGDD